MMSPLVFPSRRFQGQHKKHGTVFDTSDGRQCQARLGTVVRTVTSAYLGR